MTNALDVVICFNHGAYKEGFSHRNHGHYIFGKHEEWVEIIKF